MKTLTKNQRAYVVDEIDSKVGNKFKWNWMEICVAESIKDRTVDYKLADCFEKVDVGGKALCTWCGDVVNYGSRGKTALVDHVKTSKHKKNAGIRLTNYTIGFGTTKDKTDPETWVKCLSIVSEFMENATLKTLSPTIQMIIETLILPGIQNENADVRHLAVKSLGLCCLLKKETALQHLVLFVQASQVDTEEVRAIALSILFDLLHKYGLEVLQNETNNTPEEESQATDHNTTEMESSTADQLDNSTASNSVSQEEEGKDSRTNTASNLLTILSSALDIESSELRTVAAEGLAKLLLSGRVMSAKLLSHLILLWYNPVTEEDTHLRHCLGTFFPVFAIAGRCNQEVLEEAFMPTMRTIFNAPSSSPLADVDANNVAELLTQLTSARLLAQNQNIMRDQIKDHVIHDNLALEVCNEILSHPDSFSVKVLVKTLNNLHISSDDISLVKNLSALSEQMLETVKEKMCVKGLQKFDSSLSEMLEKLKTPEEISNDTILSEETQVKTEEVHNQDEGVQISIEVEKLDIGESGQGDITVDQSKNAGATWKTPGKSVKKSKPRASTKTPAPYCPTSDLENSVFLSPTPIRKSSTKTKAVGISSDVLDDSKLRVPSSGRKLSRRVLLNVDNTSLQEPAE